MKVKMILPALTEAKSPFWRPIKYSLFPPLGLATLAGYLSDDAEIEIQDEHVEALNLADTPDLVVIQVYITSSKRAYRIADHYRERGAYVALGGLHVTSLPAEAMRHADTVFLGGLLCVGSGVLAVRVLSPRYPATLHRCARTFAAFVLGSAIGHACAGRWIYFPQK